MTTSIHEQQARAAQTRDLTKHQPRYASDVTSDSRAILERNRRAETQPALVAALREIAAWTCDCAEPDGDDDGTCRSCIAAKALTAAGEAVA